MEVESDGGMSFALVVTGRSGCRQRSDRPFDLVSTDFLSRIATKVAGGLYDSAMMRRLVLTAMLCLSLLGLAGTATYAATPTGGLPAKCTVMKNGELPTCVENSDGTWTAEYSNSGSDGGFGDTSSGGGGIPAGFVVLFILLAIGGIGVTIWRVSMARGIARQAGLSPGQATAVTLLGNDGLDAAYLAASLHNEPRNHPAPVAPVAPSAAAMAQQRLEDLSKLKLQGLITAAEYDTQRAQIIGSV
jgi:hypothetical protein